MDRFEGRREDRRLTTGYGKYTDDDLVADALCAAFVRSPIAHATIRKIDTAAAARASGVLAVFTGQDLRDAGYGDLPCVLILPTRYGEPPLGTPRPALAVERVRYVGEPIAVVIAETMAAAVAACEAVAVDLKGLPAVTDVRAAAEPSSPQVWPHVPQNCAATYTAGDPVRVEAALARAAHRFRLRRPISRLIVAAMEPRAATARYDKTTCKWHLHAASQGVRILHAILANVILNTSGANVQVTTADVGGGFGAKIEIYPEYVCLLHAARTLSRPVHWCCSRSESFLTDNHARDSYYDVDMGVAADGHIIGLKVSALQSLGAYLSSHALAIQRSFIECISSMYAIPAVYVHTRSIVTTTTPTGPFRGAGRPEAAYVIESLIEEAARRIGMDAHELRRVNFIPINAFPYATPQALTYDCGDFPGIASKAARIADLAGFPVRRAASEAKGLLRGLGTACFVETAGGAPLEAARLSVRQDGKVLIFSPTQTNGQSHETVFPMMVAERLGISADEIVLIAGDSDVAPGEAASGSYGSRSSSVFGAALIDSTDALVEKGRRLAALRFSVPVGDITYQGGRYAAHGASTSCTLAELADWAAVASDLPDDLAEGLTSEARFVAPGPTFPNGCHICEVEIDPETGKSDVVNYVAVDDCGNLVVPTLAYGQIQGGIAQGIGQALGEACIYDDEGQLLTGSFLDYAMPRADGLPAFTLADHGVPTRVNQMGVKGAGEAGTTGALAATMNAVSDALASRGIAAIDMPATPYRVWHALRGHPRACN